MPVRHEALGAGGLLQRLERVDVVAGVDHGHVETLPAHARDQVVVLPATILHGFFEEK